MQFFRQLFPARQRVKRIPAVTANNVKSYPSPDWYPLGFGFTGNNSDLTYSKAGAAGAFTFEPAVNGSVQSISGSINLLDWNICLYPNGLREEKDKEVIASKGDLQNRHPLQRAMRQFYTEHEQPFLETVAYDYLLFGEVYFERCMNEWGGNRSLERLNPLGVQVFYLQEIEYFRYGWNRVFVNIPPEKVAYMHSYNPSNDFLGLPPPLVIMNDVNIARNLDRFLNDYFANNARPGLVLSPVSEEGELSDTDVKNLRRLVAEQLKGVGGQYRTLVSKIALNVDAQEQPDISKNTELDDSKAQDMYEFYGVPRAMRGNTSATPYKDGDETTQRFYLDTVLPLAGKIQEWINIQIMPFFDTTEGLVVFEFDTSAFDTVTEADKLEADVVNSQVQNSYLSLADAARIQERTVEDWMEGVYMVRGIPMNPQQMKALVDAEVAAAHAGARFGGGGDSLVDTPRLPSIEDERERPQEKIIVTKPPTPQLGAGVAISSYEWELSEGAEIIAKQHPDTHEHGAAYIHKLYNGHTLYPDEDTIALRIQRELDQWQKFAVKGYKNGGNERDFQAYMIPPYMRYVLIDALDAVSDVKDIYKAFSGVWKHPHVRSVNSYQAALRELSTLVWRGEITPENFSSRLNVRIGREFENAFIEGVERAGLTFDDLTPDDVARLPRLISNEQSRTLALGEWIQENARGVGRLGDVRQRVDNWVARYNSIAELAFVEVQKDKPLTWRYDVRKEHCTDCENLNGKTYRGSQWLKMDIHPQSSKLECFGIWCGCRFEDASEPISRGRPPRIRGPR